MRTVCAGGDALRAIDAGGDTWCVPCAGDDAQYVDVLRATGAGRHAL